MAESTDSVDKLDRHHTSNSILAAVMVLSLIASVGILRPRKRVEFAMALLSLPLSCVFWAATQVGVERTSVEGRQALHEALTSGMVIALSVTTLVLVTDNKFHQRTA